MTTIQIGIVGEAEEYLIDPDGERAIPSAAGAFKSVGGRRKGKRDMQEMARGSRFCWMAISIRSGSS